MGVPCKMVRGATCGCKCSWYVVRRALACLRSHPQRTWSLVDQRGNSLRCERCIGTCKHCVTQSQRCCGERTDVWQRGWRGSQQGCMGWALTWHGWVHWQTYNIMQPHLYIAT